MGAPREMRIHVQRVMAIPAQHDMPPPAPRGDDLGAFQPPPLPPHQDHAEVRATCCFPHTAPVCLDIR